MAPVEVLAVAVLVAGGVLASACIAPFPGPDFSADAGAPDGTVHADGPTLGHPRVVDGATRPRADARAAHDAHAGHDARAAQDARKASADATSDARDAREAPDTAVPHDAVPGMPDAEPRDASGCDGGCGACETCSAGECEYQGSCSGRSCGPDSCGNGGPAMCGSCGACESCSAAGACVYAGNCTGRSCGPDSCGNGGATACGACGACEACNGASQCQYAGTCSGLSCGPDSCGNGGANACGGCQSNYLCSGGQCLGACYARCCPASSCGAGALEGPWAEPTEAACKADHESSACPNGGVWKMSWANTEDFYVRGSCPGSC